MPPINNIEASGLTQLWASAALPWQATLPWFYPDFTRINNTEAT